MWSSESYRGREEVGRIVVEQMKGGKQPIFRGYKPNTRPVRRFEVTSFHSAWDAAADLVPNPIDTTIAFFNNFTSRLWSAKSWSFLAET